MEKHKDKNKTAKKNKHKDKNKSKYEDKQEINKPNIAPHIASLPRTTVVADDVSLVNAVMTNTPFELGLTYTSMTIPTSTHVLIAPIMDALGNNTTVKELIVPSRPWEQKELRDFIRCLSSANKGIKTIILRANDFNPHFIEALTKILKSNLQIKTLEISTRPSATISAEGFARFCDSMEYYHFEELIMMNTGMEPARYKLLFDSLKFNQSIKIIKLTGDVLAEAPFESLCNSLAANPTVTDLSWYHIGITEDCLKYFKRVLNANYIKKLSIMYTNMTTDGWQHIVEEFKNNTSITDLTVQFSQLDWKLFGKILSHNKTIKKLDISSCTIKEDELPYLNLRSNTTLEELIIERCWNVGDNRVLLSELLPNKHLRRLDMYQNSNEFDHDGLQRLISENNLVEFKIRSDYHPLKNEVLIAIAAGLRVNRTLRKLTVWLPTVDLEPVNAIVNALWVNNTLREWHTTPIQEIYLNNKPHPYQTTSMEDLIYGMLHHNKTLRYITGAELYPRTEKLLRDNIDAQDKIVNDTCALINMILAKPNSFILPVEIWLNVFKHVSYTFGSYDFERYMRSRLN